MPWILDGWLVSGLMGLLFSMGGGEIHPSALDPPICINGFGWLVLGFGPRRYRQLWRI